MQFNNNKFQTSSVCRAGRRIIAWVYVSYDSHVWDCTLGGRHRRQAVCTHCTGNTGSTRGPLVGPVSRGLASDTHSSVAGNTPRFALSCLACLTPLPREHFAVTIRESSILSCANNKAGIGKFQYF